MYQQNSINFSHLLNSNINTPSYGSVKPTKLLRQGGEEALFIAQSNKQSSQEFILKFQKNMNDSEKSFIKQLMDYQRQQDNDPNSNSGIITILETFPYQKYNIILMEIGKSNLHDYFKTQSNVSMEQKIEICADLIRSISFLHSQKIFHKDIKPENFFFVGNRFKLIDFGLIIKGLDQNKNQIRGVEQLLYSAPEVIEQKNDNPEKVDIWALGCVIYEILSGKSYFTRYEETQDIKNEINNYIKNKDSYHKKIDQLQILPQQQKTLKQMLDHDPQNRISISDASKIFIKKQSETQINPVLQTQINPLQQTQINPVQQTQINPLQQTQMNSVQQAQINPLQQTQINPVLQTQFIQAKQPQGNQIILQQQIYQQPNQSIQYTQPFLQQTIQKQQIPQAHIEQVCQLILGEIKKQVSQNQNQQQEVENTIKENDSIQSQNDVENALNSIITIIHNLNNKVQEIQNQQIQEIQKDYESKLDLKDQQINQQKQRLEDIEKQNINNQESITKLNQQSQEQQNLNDLVDQVLTRFQNYKQKKQEKQQEEYHDEDEVHFQRLSQELNQGLQQY